MYTPNVNIENAIMADASQQQINTWRASCKLVEGQEPPVLYLHTLIKEVNPDALAQSVDALVKRHESLRTVFPLVDGTVKQLILPYNSGSLPMFSYDLSHCGDFSAECLLLQRTHADKLSDVQNGPLFSVLLLKGVAHYVVCIMVHHLISDAWSMKIIREELNACYKAFINKHVPPMPVPAYQLKDYCKEQSLYIAATTTSSINYWRRKLGHFEKKPELEKVLNDGKALSYTKTIVFDEPGGVNKLQNKYRCSVGPVLYGSLFILLAYVKSKEQILLALPVADRYTPDKRMVVGNLMGGIYLCRSISPDAAIKELIGDIQMEYLKSCRYTIFDHPSAKINGAILRDNCDLYINFASLEINGSRQENSVTEEGHKSGHGIHYALECFIFEYDNLLSFNWRYNTKLFTGQEIARLAEAHSHILMALMNDACIKVADVMDYISTK